MSMRHVNYLNQAHLPKLRLRVKHLFEFEVTFAQEA